VELPGGFVAPALQVEFVRRELQRVREALEAYAGWPLSDEMLAVGIRRANRFRRELGALRRLVFTAPACPLPALEMLIAEMLAVHFCSDQDEALAVVQSLRAEAEDRVAEGVGVLSPHAVRVYWVNPVADLRTMNLLEDLGGRVCGTEYLFCHAIEPIPEDIEPLEALARTALADPMVGSSVERAERIARESTALRAEALVISRIPGASHCAWEGTIIGEVVRQRCGIPVLEIEVPPITDSIEPSLRTRLEALLETAQANRG
jgi:benzoyl-CoA reductase/2-hydroxyglutaryl-CoA dehydratase subunit BcrC/BadD/HgdB